MGNWVRTFKGLLTSRETFGPDDNGDWRPRGHGVFVDGQDVLEVLDQHDGQNVKITVEYSDYEPEGNPAPIGNGSGEPERGV